MATLSFISSSKHLPILETRTVHWHDEAACRLTAESLAAKSSIGVAYIELRGPLGAGKTTFVRYLLQALGVEGRIKSPTYAVMEPYELRPSGVHEATNAWHFDFYRFNDPREWEDAGFRDIFASPGLKLAEWPEQAAGLAPEPDLRIEIRPDSMDAGASEGASSSDDIVDVDGDGDITPPDARTVTFSALTPVGLELLP